MAKIPDPTQLPLDLFSILRKNLRKFRISEENEIKKHIRTQIINLLRNYNYKRFPKNNKNFEIYIERIIRTQIVYFSDTLMDLYDNINHQKKLKSEKEDLKESLFNEKKRLNLSNTKKYIEKYGKIPQSVLDYLANDFYSIYDNILDQEPYHKLHEAFFDLQVGRFIDSNSLDFVNVLIYYIIQEKFIIDQYGRFDFEGGIEEVNNLFEKSIKTDLPTLPEAKYIISFIGGYNNS